MSIPENEFIVGSFDGPRALVQQDGETRWQVTPARATAEIEARARLAAHPLAAAAMERRADTLVFAQLDPIQDVADAVERLLPASAAPLERAKTPRQFLVELGGPVDAVRALGRAGLPRSRVDRFLDRAVTIRTVRGIDLGGVMPAAIRSGAAGLTAISVRYGRVDGWPVIDLASLTLRAEIDARGAHERAGGNTEAFELAMIHQALRELTAEREEPRRERLRELIASIVERFVPIEPDRVTLSVEAPAFLDSALFAPLGDVQSAHARRVLRDWDGLAVGGSVVRVRTEPALARPARLRAFEPARERRQRLFSRFYEGIAFDDEGLFSATPEALADRIALGLHGVVLDATCGIGSLTLALARSANVSRVIAIDRDPERVRMTAHNAGLYGVRDRIELHVGDALTLVPTLRFDALVIDPPWGGRDYDRERVTLDDLGMPIGPLLARPGRVVLKLPRSFDVSTLPEGFEIEAAIDARGVLKMLIARRGVASTRSR